MAVERFETRRVGQHETDDSGPRMEIVTASFLELFELLETYAPSWYTEEHHNRAMAALRALRTFVLTR